MTLRWQGPISDTFQPEPMVRVTAFELAVEEPKLVAIDVDSVMFPINELVILPALKFHGIEARMSDITSFDYADCLGVEAKKIAFECFRNPALYDAWHMTQAEYAVLARLRDLSRLVAVSSPFAEHAASKWRFCQRAGFDHKDIVLAGDKTLLNFDLLIDDRPETLMALPADRVIVYDRPWNRDVTDRVRVHRFSDLPAAVAMLLEGR